jgi:hypothetical protein
MKRLTLILLLMWPVMAQDVTPAPERLVAPSDSAAVTEEEIDAAWASYRRPTGAALQAKLTAWHRFCEGHGGLDFAEPARYCSAEVGEVASFTGDDFCTEFVPTPRPVAAWSHPQTFGASPILIVRGTNKIAMTEQLCLPVFTDGRKDEKVLRAFLYADRVLEDAELVTKKQLRAAIANARLVPVEPEEPEE